MVTHRVSTLVGFLFLLVSLWVPVAAAQEEDDAEFAFNLFSDVGPIVALFGEQFARQYMSESLTWLDHLIFAMVPVGILTAITSALRVQGPHVARAFIGRARENRALVEYELMSSTSHEVGEAFNGRGIVRVMGRPKVVEFLIFPRDYEQAEVYYKENSNVKPHEETTEAKHVLCGIHSLESVVESTYPLMKLDYYCSYSYNLIRSFFGTALESNKRTEEPDTESGATDPKVANESDDPLRRYISQQGAPNLQLNFSADHLDVHRYKKRTELMLSAVLAVVLQAGLIVLAAAATSYRPLSNSANFEIQVYGLSCYIVGSILLSLGVGLCAYAVERNTTEYAWTPYESRDQEDIREPQDSQKSYPHLLFLQKQQTVNDQVFGAYAMLAGPKRQIIASRRNPSSSAHTNTKEVSKEERKKLEVDRWWETITVIAAAAAGIGFTAQFMGLRGLPYPCSIAQVLAIITMTLIRASIRRRLGREPAHCQTFAEFELDHLSTCITFFPSFRNLGQPVMEQDEKDSPSPGDIFRWEIKLPSSETFNVQQRQRSNGHAQKFESSSTVPFDSEATGEQLLRVRRRLGDLCRWDSVASRQALALSKSIEMFMNTFLPLEGLKNDQRTFTWDIEASGPTPPSEPKQYAISFNIEACEKSGSWSVDIGKLEAVLSLWMAKIVAGLEKKKQRQQEADAGRRLGASSGAKRDWRRGAGRDTTRHSFWRILGESLEDGVLKRDLSWWVGESFTIHAASPLKNSDGKEDNITHGEDQTENPPTVVNDPDFIIGFNRSRLSGEESEAKERREEVDEIVIGGEDTLPNILAQHLFTDFVWAVSKSLPVDCLPLGFDNIAKEVDFEGRDRFDQDNFVETWYLPKLSHKKLATLVRQIESFGMGSKFDILLCIIPAFSFRDLLPNRAMLQLLPPFGKERAWTEARCYKNLLATHMRTIKAEIFCYAVVIYTMDFLYMTHQPYEKFLRHIPGLTEELTDIVKVLGSKKFEHIVKKLVPMHQLQGRRIVFESIFRQYSPNPEDFTGTPNLYEVADDGIDEHPWTALGFSPSHWKLYNWRNGRLGRSALRFKDEDIAARDIFGWTPIHYSCVNDAEGEDSLTYCDRLWYIFRGLRMKNLHKQLDRFKRSPVHVAAANGLSIHLRYFLWYHIQEHSEISAALTTSDAVGMTPLHGAAQLEKPDCLDELMKVASELKKEAPHIWFDKPIHIDTTDSSRQTPLHCAILACKTRVAIHLIEEKKANASAKNKSEMTPLMLAVERNLPEVAAVILKSISSASANAQDISGFSAWHYAVRRMGQASSNEDHHDVLQLLTEHEECDLSLKDSDGRTALQEALSNNNASAAFKLIDVWKKRDPDLELDGKLLLIEASKFGCTKVVPKFIEWWPGAINDGDAEHDQPPLSWALERHHNEIVKILVGDPRTDLNRTAKRWGQNSPLHFAVMRDNPEAVAILLGASGQVDVNIMARGRTPMDVALELDNVRCAKMLLEHPGVSGTDFKRSLAKSLRLKHPQVFGLYAELFQSIVQDALTDSDYLAFIEHSGIFSNLASRWEDFMIRALDGTAWIKVQDPYLTAVQAQSAKVVKKLLEKGVDHTNIDEDNWSLAYCATRYGTEQLLNGIDQHLLRSENQDSFQVPDKLMLSEVCGSVSLGECDMAGHDKCAGLNVVRLSQFDPSKEIRIRSKHCVSPLPTTKIFYFEIKVLEDCESRSVGLGFCRKNMPENRMPGWEGGSWAYHGDDGCLFIESGHGLEPSSDFGDAGKFSCGDVAGVGLNMETGEGFCTLNGRLLDMGEEVETIRQKRFHTGKIYPCVGFTPKEPLRFEVNFGGSDRHPFMYKGSLG